MNAGSNKVDVTQGSFSKPGGFHSISGGSRRAKIGPCATGYRPAEYAAIGRAAREWDALADLKSLLVHHLGEQQAKTPPFPPVEIVQNETEKLLKTKENARKKGPKRT